MPDSMLSTLHDFIITSQQPYEEGQLRLEKIKPLARGPKAGLQNQVSVFRAQHVVAKSLDSGPGLSQGEPGSACYQLCDLEK